MLLHILRHIDAHHGVLVVEQKFRQRPRQLGLTDARRPEENERTNRAVGIAESGARTPDGVGHALNRFVLSNNALPQTVFHRDQLLHFAFQHLRHRNAGPLADDLSDVFLVDLFLQHARLLAVHRSAELLHLSLELRQFAILDLRGAIVVALAGGFLLLQLQLLDALFRRAYLGDGFLLLSLELRQFAILDLRGAIVVALAGGFLLLQLQLLDALFRRAYLGDGFLLLLPARLQSVGFFFDVRQLFLQGRQPFA